MRRADLVRLLVLAALWGASFLLLRIIVPSLGTIATAESRVLIAGVALLVWHRIVREPFDWRAHRKPLFVVGLFNSAIPFTLFAFAAARLPAGYLAFLNATSPLFGALIARAWFGEPLGWRRIAGIACGALGVAMLVRLGPVALDAHALAACAACLGAAACYGFAGNYTKRLARPVAPTAMATGSQLAAALVITPMLLFEPIHSTPSAAVIGAVLVVAIASTAVAYLLYFRLIRDVGATRALTVTFLVPMFAIGWAWLVLGEEPTARMAIGGALIVVATWLVIGAKSAEVVKK